jgi:hypothetical protein
MPLSFKGFKKTSWWLIGVAAAFLLVALLAWKERLSPEIPEFSWRGEREEKRDTLPLDNTDDRAALGYTGQRKIVEDTEGNAYLAYRKKWNGDYEIFVTKVIHDQTGVRMVGAERPIAPVGADVNQRVPALAIDSRDRIHAVWYGADSEREENNRQIKYAFSEDGGHSWSAWKNIAWVDGFGDEDYWQEHPSIFAGKDDTLYVTWEGKDAVHEAQQVKFTKSADGGKTWSPWVNIRPTEGRTQSRPSIVEDTDGRLHLFMYSSFGNTVQQILWAVSTDKGEGWSEWQRLSDERLDSRHVSATAGEDGRVHAVWRSGEDDDTPSQIYYAVREREAWSSPVPVVSSAAFQFFPTLSVDRQGRVWVAWMETEDDTDFPREHPEEDGRIRIAFRDAAEAEFTEQEGEAREGLYPLLPLFSRGRSIPLGYASQMEENDDRFQVWLAWL